MDSPQLKSKKAGRLSSLLSLGNFRDDFATTSSQSSSPDLDELSPDGRNASPRPRATLSKSTSIPDLSIRRLVTSASSREQMPPPISTASLAPLQPPPVLTGHERSRSATSHGTVSSAPSSRAASRESSRSRTSTPVQSGKPDGAGSPTTRLKEPKMLLKRQSFLPKKQGQEKDLEGQQPKGWIAGLREQLPYDLSPVFQGVKVAELWDESANTFIYLFPRKSGKGPSFKIASSLLSGSKSLTLLARHDDPASLDMHQLSVEPTQQAPSQDQKKHLPPQSPAIDRSTSSSTSSVNMRLTNDFQEEDSEERHLYMPLELHTEGSFANPDNLTPHDMELLILYRNLFAFLHGGALVGTPRQPTLFAIFLGIGSILARFGFSNLDGSTFGEVVSSSFSRYSDELRLMDIRSSREKTIEAIVLGEKMKAWSLYNEGFVHGAGKLAQIKNLNSPKYALITAVTRNRLERAALDLQGRIRTVRNKLSDFEFPSMFSGIANSQMAVEAKTVRFKAWKTAFFDFRKQAIAHYRQRYGAWPPKARSKKNNFEESGLNRLLLREVYQDFTDLYDMLADRTQLTNRKIDMEAPDDDVDFNDSGDSITHAIRRVMSEYDRSTPPVQPPMPFDTPLFPSLSTSFHRGHVVNHAKDTKDRARRLRDNEVSDLLLGSYNRESMKATPFLQDFLQLERRSGNNCTISEIVDTRCGQWIFMYAVLQSLPMVVVDARDIRFSQGVEYFLCVPPRGGRPWIKEDTSQSRNWYNVASGGGLVSLPADTIDHSVEGIYRRSHCWTVAAKWASISDAMSPATKVSLGAAFPPPPVVGSPRLTSTAQIDPQNQSPVLAPDRSLNDSPDPAASSTTTINHGSYVQPPKMRNSHNFSFGLEALPLPRGVAPDGTLTSGSPGGGARPISIFDPNKTFDSILAGVQKPDKKGKK